MGSRADRPVPTAATAATVVLVLVALLGGCGGDASAPTPTPVPPTPTATPEEQARAWTESVCGALVPVVAHLTAAPRFDINQPEATRQAYLTYLDDGVATTDAARAAIAAAGPAPVPDGDVVADQVRGTVADLRTDLVAARDQVAKTDTSSTVALGRTLVGVTRVVSALLNGAKVAATINRVPALQAAYAQSPMCARLQRSGAPATPSPDPGVPPSSLVVPTR